MGAISAAAVDASSAAAGASSAAASASSAGVGSPGVAGPSMLGWDGAGVSDASSGPHSWVASEEYSKSPGVGPDGSRGAPEDGPSGVFGSLMAGAWYPSPRDVPPLRRV